MIKNIITKKGFPLAEKICFGYIRTGVSIHHRSQFPVFTKTHFTQEKKTQFTLPKLDVDVVGGFVNHTLTGFSRDIFFIF